MNMFQNITTTNKQKSEILKEMSECDTGDTRRAKCRKQNGVHRPAPFDATAKCVLESNRYLRNAMKRGIPVVVSLSVSLFCTYIHKEIPVVRNSFFKNIYAESFFTCLFFS